MTGQLSDLHRPCTFFIEQNPADFRWRPVGFNRGLWLNSLLFEGPRFGHISLAQHLKDQGHGVALALINLDAQTAATVLRLNEMGVNVTAWLVLPEQQGYRSNPANVGDTVYRLDLFMAWLEKYELSFQRLGIDWEVPIQVHLLRNGKKLYPHAFRQYLRGRNFKALALLQSELAYIQSFGLYTEIYAMPSLLGWAFGLSCEPKVDRRVIMAYSSVIPGSFGSTRLAYKLMCAGYPNASVAYGIASGETFSSPGRDFGNGILPRHLSLVELAKCIKATPDSNAKQPPYLFALNNFQVVHMWESAVKLAGG